ncbi:MAG: rubrerythrin family protein [Candidatus Aenigmarchaeota archaeon]|nr:rubrerythrin family protein [Candidatus Aenigmarchaeota archaeon]
MGKTFENLAKAFAGESQARNRYTIYSKIAKKEGFEQIAEIFLATADNEREHAKWLMKMINQIKTDDKPIIIEADVPTIVGTTEENLKAAIEGENFEHTKMYPEFAEIAEKENMGEIAVRLRAIGTVEKHHELRYKKLLEDIKNNTVFEKKEDVSWVCRKCGFVYHGKNALEKCPSCNHPKSYFEVLKE